MNSMLLFATTEAAGEKGDLLSSLGVDLRLLVIQAVAFLVLLWVLGKFVYPVLSGMLEKREATIREGLKAAEKAEQKAVEANAEVEELLSDARKQAKEVIALAKEEAAAIVETAHENAATQTERMLKKAGDEIEKEITSARKALRDETINLVALATEKVVAGAMTEKIDQKVIDLALKDSK